ncbi:hypothetical protein [uncultured Bacteroides sp.]|uniref:hypothetical protein n=1 Tax=uncultured Bacteroides sp. TaxID=162156 RepID=UPI002AAC439D|nr:hypothetical protein [uncultured Bacteroides sp.]
MFEKVCIKSKKSGNQKIDIVFLIDTMLFYGEVNVLVYKEELATLLIYFGEDLLNELISSGRIKLHIRQEIFGVPAVPVENEKHYGCLIVQKKDESLSSVLYEAHQSVIRNSTKSIAFSDRFSKITSAFSYIPEVKDHIINDFSNQLYIQKAIPELLRTSIPEYNIPQDLIFEIEKDSVHVMPFDTYSINSNIDVELINKIRSQKGIAYSFDYAGFILALMESRGDNYIAGQFESELVTDKEYSSLIGLQLTDSVQKSIKSGEQIDLFNQHILTEYPSVGEAFINKTINGKELVKLLVQGDKFREWLKTVPLDSSLINKYIEEITKETLADKKWVKGTRFAVTQIFGFIPIVGNVVSAIDTFLVDKLLKGWKPNHFIDDELKFQLK